MFLDVGINCMHPMEPAAGMHIVEIRETYGERLAFYGGLDKHVLRRTQDEIAAELERKIPPMIYAGGRVLCIDHRIPNGTPLAQLPILSVQDVGDPRALRLVYCPVRWFSIS
jgi:hypothetical protein